jgi:hypothetical protein
MNHLPKLTFIALGPEVEPRVTTIAPHSWNHYLEATALGNQRQSPKFRDHVLAEVFGKGITTIIPAWVDAALTDIVEGYAGPHADRVKQLAAVILLRESFERPTAEATKPADKPRGVTRGGKRVAIVPPTTPPLQPLGALFDEEEAKLTGAA